jgi:hypothetical protein
VVWGDERSAPVVEFAQPLGTGLVQSRPFGAIPIQRVSTGAGFISSTIPVPWARISSTDLRK